MTPEEPTRPGALVELAAALAEGYAEAPPDPMRDRVRSRALAGRAPGRPNDAPPRIPGVQVYGAGVGRLEGLLAELEGPAWASPALRGLDVQGLVGHLIGVEALFLRALEEEGVQDPGVRGVSTAAEGLDHISSTDPYVEAQRGRDPAVTAAEWRSLTARTADLVAGRPPDEPAAFYGLTLPLDQLLIIRAFEMWVHEEDVRRATHRPLNPPGPAELARMADLAVTLLPAGMTLAGRDRWVDGVRLVLTGPAGGTWDVLRPGSADPSPPSATVVVDVTSFCRVVGNRMGLEESGAWVDGDPVLAADLFAGAAALALD